LRKPATKNIDRTTVAVNIFAVGYGRVAFSIRKQKYYIYFKNPKNQGYLDIR
jgi:hypothetical protein